MVMDKQIRKHLKRKGHSPSRFVILPYNILDSPAWKNLSPGAALIYIELKKRFNGRNNGELPLSCREAAVVAHCGKGTAGKLLTELVEHGFIQPAVKGRFRNRHATTWILTSETYERRAPSNEWKEWKPQK